ncbi:FGGY-family carbohydrate kinase [Chelativorans sp.]|uniref:FGGY-family carbohydrate kinase n=1 Tax=Chelativorans sp. TaxID=2203393 RepID=UPI0028112074|nr:FGGY-family carbohydrate kinase [Chelativorans sp.]
MNGPLFIGLDAGTSLTKAAVFDLAGRQLGEARRGTTLLRPHPGWSELDPEEAWQAALDVLRRVVSESGVDRSRIAGIGLTGAMVGAWVVDGEGNALRPGITWEDSRAQGWIERRLAADARFLSRIFASSGSMMQQGCTLPVLAWLAENEPEILARAAHVMSYKDFLRMRLTGLAATDRSEASVIPGSARERTRSDAMIALFGLEKFAQLLPPVMDSERFIGGLMPAAADAIGLPSGLPVAIGAGDVPATVIGAGGLATGMATAVLGTTCMVGVCHDRPVFEPADLGLLFTLPGHRWYRAMVNVAGTLNLDWAFSALAPDLAARPDRFDMMNEMIGTVPPGAHGLVYLPYLSESGIIAPVVDYGARAQFHGLVPRHDRAALFRAVMEGVAFAMRDLFDALDFAGDRVLLTGGGAQNPVWAQMIADLAGRDVHVPEGTQFGARGAALLAATAAGHFASVADASASAAGGGTSYRSDREGAAALLPALLRYRETRDRLLRPRKD